MSLIALGIAVSLASLRGGWDQGANGCFYFLIGLVIAAFGLRRVLAPLLDRDAD